MSASIFEGSDQYAGCFGVMEDGAILYDASFYKNTAERIAELENADTKPLDWEETEAILEAEGFNTANPKDEQ
ncbi:MAG: hypothetical protein HS116_25225 [Planctomycetes bacterium]|nr:hypothetical protein [Planctomycetota bacterium]